MYTNSNSNNIFMIIAIVDIEVVGMMMVLLV